MKIILHIGWHKTGTTSIQKFLFNNATKLINRHGIYYPNEGLFSFAHHNLAWALQERTATPWGNVPLTIEGFKNKLKTAVEVARLVGCNTIVFSSEEFCTLQMNEIEILHDTLSGFFNAIKIVAYLRRQDLLIESSYNMAVKWWGSRTTSGFSDYISGKEGYPNYYSILTSWANYFGSNALVIRPFESRYFDLNDVRVDFCQQAGIDHAELSIEKEPTNESLSPSGVEFIRIINNIDMPAKVHAGMVDRILKYEKANECPSCVFFNPEDRKGFLILHEAENSKLNIFGFDTQSFQSHPSDMQQCNISQLSLDEFRRLLSVSLA